MDDPAEEVGLEVVGEFEGVDGAAVEVRVEVFEGAVAATIAGTRREMMLRANVCRRLRAGIPIWLLLTGWVPGTAEAVRVVPDAERQRAGFDARESAGLFVGVRDFEDPQLTTVSYAVDDAVDLAHLFVLELELIEAGKVVLALSGEPQKVASRLRLEKLRSEGATVETAEQSDLIRLLGEQGRAAGPRGLYVVAVASHGFSDQGSDFLVASDSRKRRIVRTGIAVSELLDDVSRAGTRRQVVLLDACRERLSSDTRSGSADNKSAFGQAFADTIAAVKGQVVLAAATVGGYAFDDHERKNGVFTAAVMSGLRGGARPDDRGLITVTSLTSYVQDEVAAWVRDHKPEHSESSRGITSKIEGAAANLPLAVDPTFVAEVKRYAERRDAALIHLGTQLGKVLTGVMFDQLRRHLHSEPAPLDADEWLSRIESLDGSRQSQESFAWFYSQRFQTHTPTSPPPRPKEPEAGDLWIEPALDMRFRYVPAGTFQMGSPATEEGREDDETQHEVTLTRGFWMGETEVTQGQWRELMGSNPSWFSKCGDECPVELVSWYEAVAFANALSERAGLPQCYVVEGCGGTLGGGCPMGYAACAGDYECQDVELTGLDCEGYRLPTEAEWERAARAGTSAARPGAGVDALAWYSGNSGSKTHRVGQKMANPWELHDLFGNVYEWTWDRYGSYPETSVEDPQGPEEGSHRVIRGGSWPSLARDCRSANRHWWSPGTRNDLFGFRLVRTLPSDL